MRAIILEDEKIAQDRLSRMLNEISPKIIIDRRFDNIKDTAEYLLAENHLDVMFLDIQVIDGLSLELFSIVEIKCHVIFTTAYDNYAVEAFRKNAIDYLLKPIKKNELVEALKRIGKLDVQLDYINLTKELNVYQNRFLIRFGAKLYSIPVDEIAYLYSKNKICYFVKKDGSKVASDYRLKDLINLLEPAKFFRINRQFIVGFDSISEMITHSRSRIKIKLKPEFSEDIVISTDRTQEFKNWLSG